MKTLLITLLTFLLAFSVPIMAGDSGAYFDPEKSGEGLFVLVNEDKTFYITYFTYGAPSNCGEPEVSPSIFGCDLNGQRWFFGVNNFNEISQTVSGNLFITEGLNYPFGDGDDVGEAVIVGLYTLVRDGKGWAMFVTRFGTTLDSDDPLFADVIRFYIPVFYATD